MINNLKEIANDHIEKLHKNMELNFEPYTTRYNVKLFDENYVIWITSTYTNFLMFNIVGRRIITISISNANNECDGHSITAERIPNNEIETYTALLTAAYQLYNCGR